MGSNHVENETSNAIIGEFSGKEEKELTHDQNEEKNMETDDIPSNQDVNLESDVSNQEESKESDINQEIKSNSIESIPDQNLKAESAQKEGKQNNAPIRF